MTPGNNGENPPEGENPPADPAADDPFGYLYADGQAAGATPPGGGGGYGYPGPRSYHQVRPVGERQYGYPPQQAAQQPYDGQAAGGPGYPQQNAHYAAPETLPGGPPAGGRRAQQQTGGRGRGPNTKGLLIGAIAVVAAVCVGIGIALGTGDSGDGKDNKAEQPPAPTAHQSQPGEDDDKPSANPSEEPEDLPKSDAKALKLDGGTTLSSDVKGAKAGDGIYVAGFNKVGAKLTWTVSGIPEDGDYTIFLDYGVPGKDQQASLIVNGGERRELPLKNWAGAPEGDWEKGWTNSYVYTHLTKGTNSIVFSCEDGDKCDANFDRLWLKEGQVKN
ncbi:dimeric protein [Streptomyces sp. NPDC007088]|uniref:dimeric protein n=1 Tax=Streptomyces sp. NPDC007088 TaxID=3364773 RepID=UPI0036A283B3